MDTRSSRSRSKTPLLILSENNQEGYASEDVVMRQTRSSTIRTSKITTSKNSNITDGHNLESYSTEPIKSKNEKGLRKTRYKTSDYSSEEGDNQVTSTFVSDQNFTNQFLEDSRRSHSRASNSSHTSALEYYRAAGDYWNKFPKTDYTYSLHSKDRTEISPGIVAMPNMSRRSLHSNNSDSFEEYSVSNKQINTEYQQSRDVVDYSVTSPTYNSENFKTKYRTKNNFQSKPIAKNLFSHQKSFLSRTYTYVETVTLTIFRLFYTAFYYIFGQNVVLAWSAKQIYKLILNVLVLDTWILKSVNHNNKLKRILALCFFPMLIFAGWWLFYGRIPLIYGSSVNFTTSLFENIPLTVINHNKVVETSLPSVVTTGTGVEKVVTIREKILLEPPNANEIASQLTPQQLEEIAHLIQSKFQSQTNDDLIIQRVLQETNIQNIFTRYDLLYTELENYRLKSQESNSGDGDTLKNSNLEIENLKEDIYQKMKADNEQLRINYDEAIAKLTLDLRAETAKYNAILTGKLNRCCRNSFIQMENYVTTILKNILGAPHYVSTQKDISDWLHSTFVAKEDLESRLANLTQHLQKTYDEIIVNNGQMIMDKIVAKIAAELDERINKLSMENNEIKGSLQVDLLSDEYIKKIVRDSLAVYDADKTGLVDYALESAGGQILSTRCTESYSSRTAVVSIFGIPLWYPNTSPRTVITPSMTPGECWAFQNFPGFLLVKLASPVKVEAFSIEHINKMLAPNGKIDSAPKEFSVYGLRNETDNDPPLLGIYEYDDNGAPLQYFVASVHDMVLEIIELRIHSNHGNPNYTCLYRFRVHGRLPM